MIGDFPSLERSLEQLEVSQSNSGTKKKDNSHLIESRTEGIENSSQCIN